jgi:hypothetical protein
VRAVVVQHDVQISGWGRAYRASCTPAGECLRVRRVHLIAEGRCRAAMRSGTFSGRRGPGFLRAGRSGASVIMDQLGPVRAAMIERLGIAGDQQHLDVATGSGERGLTVARHTESPMLRPGCAALMTCRSVTLHSTVSRYGSGTCSFPWPRRPPSSRACSGRADVFDRRYGPARGEPVDDTTGRTTFRRRWAIIRRSGQTTELVTGPQGVRVLGSPRTCRRPAESTPAGAGARR